MFLKVGGPAPQQKQRLYLMEITLPSGMVVCKVGKASGPSSTSRMMQLVESIYNKFRRTPMVYIKRDKEITDGKVFELETRLHQFFSEYRYESKQKFDGVTECFVVPLSDAVIAFDLVTDGEVPDFKYKLPSKDEDALPF